MVKLKWLKTASDDLIQIYNYIYKDSIYYSIKTINEILKLTDNLVFSKYMGRKVPEYNLREIRELIYKSYRVIYEVKTSEILILRIWHCARRLPKHLFS